MCKKIGSLRLFLITLSIIAVLATVSCRFFQSEGDGVEGPEEPVEENIESDDGVQEQSMVENIVIWESTDPKVRLQLTEDIDRFISQNPDIEIEARHLRNQEELLDEFTASSLAGSGPDIVISDFDVVRDVASDNVVRALEDDFDYSNIIEGLKEISDYQDSLYILPFRTTDFMMLYYNKELIEAPPPNFEKILEYSTEVNDAQSQTYGFLLNSTEPDWVIPFIGGYSDWIVDYYDDSITLDSRAMRETIEFLLYIHNETQTVPYGIEYEEMDLLFKNGNAHMIINGLWALSEYEEQDIDFGVMMIPEVFGGDKNPTPMIEGIGFMINVNCYGNRLSAARRFLGFMLSEDRQVGWIESTNTFPVLNYLDDSPTILSDEHIYYAYRQSKLCRGKPREELLRVIRDSIRINMESVLMGNISIDEVVQKMQEDAINLRNGSINIEELNSEDIIPEES